MKFASLIQPMVLRKDTDDFTLPGQQQREAARRFEHMFRGRGLYLWGAEPRRSFWKRVVLGVTTASLPDMRLMDDLACVADELYGNGIRVEVFNVYYFQTLQEFEKRIAGLGKVYHTPVVGVQEDGEWMIRATGYQARRFIQELIGDLAEKSSRRFLFAPAKEPKV